MQESSFNYNPQKNAASRSDIEPAPLDVKDIETIADTQSSEVPMYVRIYDVIYRMIENSTAKTGQLLPGENVLASHWNVSRGTVRQALKLLGEDGFINQTRGKGTTIAARAENGLMGVQWCCNPCMDFSTMSIDRVDVSLSFQGCGQFSAHTLEIAPGSLLAFANCAYYHGDKQCSAMLAFFPASLLDTFQVDVNNKDEITLFVTKMIYDKAIRSEAKISALPASELENVNMDTKDREIILFIEEVLRDAQDKPLAFVKHYLARDCYRLQVGRKARI